MKTTRRSILSLIFGAAAAPAAVAVAKAMPVAPPVGTVLRIRLPNDYQVFDRTLLNEPSGILPGRITYRKYLDFPIDAVRVRNQ